MKKVVLLYVLSFVFLVHTQSDNFILITSLYNEKNEARIAEYITCMEKNLAHPLIDTIHVLYDFSNDTEENSVLNFLLSKPVTIHYIYGRSTYDQCFELVNLLHPDRRIIISNADIYFNKTLNLLDSYDLRGKFLALTRWDIQTDGSLKIFTWPGDQPHSGSQDTWIFRAPIRSFEDKTIAIGVPHCDIRLSYQANKSGLIVRNPCLSIQCCHLHLSGIRNYVWLNAPQEIMMVPGSILF